MFARRASAERRCHRFAQGALVVSLLVLAVALVVLVALGASHGKGHKGWRVFLVIVAVLAGLASLAAFATSRLYCDDAGQARFWKAMDRVFMPHLDA